MRWPCGRRGLAALVEHLHDDRGRRQHEAHAGDERDRRRQAGQDADAGQQRAADHDLRDAEAEDLAPQAPQPRRLHLEPDDEQEHHHAEFGDVQDGLRVGEQPQPERADHEAGGQVAQHRAEPEPLEERHRDDARRQQGHHLDQFDALRFRCHASSNCRKWRLTQNLEHDPPEF